MKYFVKVGLLLKKQLHSINLLDELAWKEDKDITLI
jgi:hypothetical protein